MIAFELAEVRAIDDRDDRKLVDVAQGDLKGQVGIEIGKALGGENGAES